jgi:hypothetical protein
VRKFAGVLSLVAPISAQEGVITARAWQQLQHLESGFPNLHLAVMYKLKRFSLLRVKMPCSQLGIAQLKQPSTMIMVTVGVLLLMRLLIPLCLLIMHPLFRPVLWKLLHCVTINALACFRAATFANAPVTAHPLASVPIFLAILVG